VRVDAICYDGAFRGKHIDHVMKQGLIALVPTHADTAKPSPHRTIDCGCGDTHAIWTKDRRLQERLILDIGDTDRIDNTDDTDDDARTGYNRAEHLRQSVKTDEGNSIFDRCYGWREDSESLNNTLDRTLYGGRITAHSAVRQHSVMIGFALGRNAIAAFIHRRQHQLEKI